MNVTNNSSVPSAKTHLHNIHFCHASLSCSWEWRR